MGLAYAVGTTITYPVTGAALNPARATGIAIFAQNQGLNEEPLQQLWCSGSVRFSLHAVVALVIIFTMMLSRTRRTPRPMKAMTLRERESSETEEDLHADGNR